MKEKELFTRQEIMEYLSISSATLHRLMKRNAFPYIKLEKKVLFKKRDVDAYLEAHLVKARH
jgi:excisionase family DNA binding protein